jgi:hypothetical protein
MAEKSGNLKQRDLLLRLKAPKITHTYSMVQDILWKADRHSACQTIACFLYGTRRFITVFTKARHWALSWASRIQFAPSIPSSVRSILMLSSQYVFMAWCWVKHWDNWLAIVVSVLLVLYGCETWSLTRREEHKLRAFENRVLRRIFGPKREEVAGGWRRLHNDSSFITCTLH